MLAPITHIIPVTTIRRERRLPVMGRVLVRKGQQVNALEVLAEADLAPEHLLLDVSRALGLPASKADQFLQRHEGDEVSEGDVIAGPVGIGRRVLRAPKSGRIVLAGGGQVLLELEGQPYELKACFPGTVADLIADRGAVIETNGALIQGAWGNGKADFGLLNIIARAPDDELTRDRLDVSLRGSIVMGGYCDDPDALRAGNDLPLRGLILASLDASLLSLAQKAIYPIILLEGFGRLAMNAPAYKLLTTSERRDVSLNAESWDQLRGNRPEIVVPLPAVSDGLVFAPDVDSFKVGAQVKILRAPLPSVVGKLVSLRLGKTPLKNGLCADAAEVQLENGETHLLPLANLEMLE